MKGAVERVHQLPDLVKALFTGVEIESLVRAVEGEWNETAIHASDLGAALPGVEGCLRQIWLRVRGAEHMPPSLGEMLMFYHGNRFHERASKLIRRGLREAFPDWHIYRTEVNVTGTVWAYSAERGLEQVHMQLDVDLRHKPSGTLAVIDYKTRRGAAFQHLFAPKESNVVQTQAYLLGQTRATEREVEIGGLVYLDREGSNAAKLFQIGRNDARVQSLADTVARAVRSDLCPPMLSPVVKVNENKGDNSVEVKSPWPCDWCSYRDISCPGALPPEQRDRGIVAKVRQKDGELYTYNGTKDAPRDNADMLLLAQRLYDARPTNQPEGTDVENDAGTGEA